MTIGEKLNLPPFVNYYGLFYYPSINRFVDLDGNILHDVSDFFDIWELEEWKKIQDCDVLIDRNGDLCDIYYSSQEEEESFLTQLKMKEGRL